MNKGLRNALLSLWVLTIAGLGIYFGSSTEAQRGLVNANDVSVDGTLDTTAQTLPFSQDWTNTSLITANGNWNGVPGIVGYRGDINPDPSPTGIDPRTILNDLSTTPLDVLANNTNPTAATSGGLIEAEIANPVVGFQGSGTADAPHLVVSVTTVGKQNIRVRYLARDIDAQSTPAVQQVDTQFRVGGSGNYTSVTGGYIANAAGTTGSTATAETQVDVTLPTNANNQSLVQIRIITTNAPGSDEWIGIDNIQITGDDIVSSTPTPTQAGVTVTLPTLTPSPGGSITVPINVSDLTGKGVEAFDIDLRFDQTVLTPTAVSSTGTLIPTTGWTITPNIGVAGRVTISGFGTSVLSGAGTLLNINFNVIGAAGSSTTLTFQKFLFNEGEPTVSITPGSVTIPAAPTPTPTPIPGYNPLGDFNGDGKTDFSILRAFVDAPVQWWTAINGTDVASAVSFGQPSDYPINADFDGDGKADIAAWRPEAGAAYFWILQSSNQTVRVINFGLEGDDPTVVGDYDGDGKDDPAVYRCPATPGQCYFYYQASNNNPSGGITFVPFGNSSNNPVPVAGDYDGDGKMDFTVAITSGSNNLYVTLKSSNGGVDWTTYGLTTDVLIPRADYDGDGKTDLVIARPIQNGQTSNYQVWVRRSGNGASEVFTFGLVGDYVAFGDYDGDGRTDAAIWREGAQGAPSGFWIRYSSTGAATFYQFGTVGDYPTNDWVMPGE